MPQPPNDSDIVYAEALPDQCPPSVAVDAAYPLVLRFVPAASADEVVDEHFLSFEALGEPLRKNIDPCSWASCSLFESERCAGFKDAAKLPKMREKRVAVLSLPEGAGRSTRNSRGHIHLWRYAGFDPLSLVTEVRDHGNS